MKHCLNVDWSNWANFFGLPKMLSVTSSNAKISQSNKWTLLSEHPENKNALRGKHPENKNTYNYI